MDTLFHGIKVNEPLIGIRPLLGVASAVIGLVATAPDADAAMFPLDKPVLITDIRTALGKAGEQGTLPLSLGAIADQVSPVCVVVRVEQGADVTGTEANLVGDAAAYSGVHALLAAESHLGVRPRILGIPGLDSRDGVAELLIVAKKLRGFVYASCNGAASIAEAVTYRGEFSERELMLIHPDWSGFSGHAVAAAMGLRAKIDEDTGWHKTLSNVPVSGVTGMSAPVFFDLQDASTDAGVLNAAPVTTLVRMNGYRYWGNRTCSDEAQFAFESAVRTSQVLQDTIAQGLAWAVDKPLSPQPIRDVRETIDAEFRPLKGEGRIIGAETLPLDPALNSADALAAGRVVIDYDYTPCAPAENMTLNQRISDRFYASFADQVAAL
ncbi:phage tail sheath subtilisin-like domain-containing protein [Novosphingopyxis sp. YJ-S2-01]|uniref:phage tail sheath subtilisin-like domain-containing protein n=1 Tax=Novosphingopyxis sp. YJ-S2-01 TaxID=2794021 RepID=UPI0018DDB863|nr:phage tail sheath subtilisin-like domain-containing protein [Novosphingopyxis sp. YJ-S2-01]MBH9536922.1 phage tail sheath subtilisin-like domain-containing protein [Novosphingopyxis sp. YJ-S2-01]